MKGPFLAAFSVFFVSLPSIAYAGRPPRDDRDSVAVAILYTEESARTVAGLVETTLSDAGFDSTLSKVEQAEEGGHSYLESNPEFYYALQLRVTQATEPQSAAELRIYTSDAVTPKILRARSDALASTAERLAADVRTYLTSKEEVRRRVMTTTADPDSVDDPEAKYTAYMNRGIFLLTSDEPTDEEFDESIGYFEAALELKPSHPSPHFNLARAYAQQDEDSLRKEHIQRGLDNDPANPDLLNEKAVLLIEQENFKEAVDILRDIPQRDPVISWNLAYALSQLDRHKEAMQAIQVVSESEANRRIRNKAEVLDAQLKEKEEQLKEKRDWNRRLKSGLWIALLGLGSVAIVGVIVLIVHRTTSKVSAADLKPQDRLAFRVQIAITTISGAFSVLSLTLTSLLG